jgi:hypothetical protein
MPSPYEPEGLRLGSVMPSCRARSEPQPSSPMPRCPHQSDRALSKVAHLGQRPDFASLGCDGCCAGRRTRVFRSTSFESALGLWRRGRAGGSSSSRRVGRLTLRGELRAAPGGLESDGGFLRGRYVSSLSERCDVENILFYNVGSVFAQATRLACSSSGSTPSRRSRQRRSRVCIITATNLQQEKRLLPTGGRAS